MQLPGWRWRSSCALKRPDHAHRQLPPGSCSLWRCPHKHLLSERMGMHSRWQVLQTCRERQGGKGHVAAANGGSAAVQPAPRALIADRQMAAGGAQCSRCFAIWRSSGTGREAGRTVLTHASLVPGAMRPGQVILELGLLSEERGAAVAGSCCRRQPVQSNVAFGAGRKLRLTLHLVCSGSFAFAFIP